MKHRCVQSIQTLMSSFYSIISVITVLMSFYVIKSITLFYYSEQNMGDIAQNHFYNYNDVLTHKDIIQYTVYFSYTGCPKKHDRRGVYRDFLGGGMGGGKI